MPRRIAAIPMAEVVVMVAVEVAVNKSYDLFLDDERFPPRASGTTVVRNWKIARTCDEAMAVVQELGIPRHISFDHDLGFKQKTGKDFANELIAWCMDNGWPGFSFSVHSMNPEGARNIECYVAQYLIQDKPQTQEDIE